jgi:hypothetical protein
MICVAGLTALKTPQSDYRRRATHWLDLGPISDARGAMRYSCQLKASLLSRLQASIDSMKTPLPL